MGMNIPPPPSPDLLDEIFLQKDRNFYEENAGACNRLDDESIIQNKVSYSHQNAHSCLTWLLI